MGRIFTIIAGLAALGLVAFGALGFWGVARKQGAAPAIAASPPSATPVATAPQVTGTGERVVDFDAAKAARSAEIASGGAPVDAAMAQIQNNPAARNAKVPVLIPRGIVQAQGAEPPSFRETPKGYYVRMRAAKYDMVVNGTREFWKEGDGPAPAKRAEEYSFEQTEGGASLGFNRFGADYLIEFECREAVEDEGCITREEAIAIAEGLGQVGN